MSRLANFDNLQYHPWFGKSFKKLSADDRRECLSFLEANKELTNGALEIAANRWYLDVEAKPKNLTRMVELIIASKEVI